MNARRLLALSAAITILGVPLTIFWARLEASPSFYLGDGFPPGQASYVMMRPAGHLAYCLLFLQIVLGLHGKRLARWMGLETLLPLHRALGFSTLGIMALHPLLFALASSLRTGKNKLWETFLPDPSAYYWAFYFFLGAIALYGTALAVAAAVWGPRWAPRAWRWIHGVNYLCLPVAWFHCRGTGNEVRDQPLEDVYGVMALAVVVMLGWRLRQAWKGSFGPPAGSPASPAPTA